MVEKDDLYLEYEWEAFGGDDPHKRGLDSKSFSRYQGFEVLPVINEFLSIRESDVNSYEYEFDFIELEHSDDEILTKEEEIQKLEWMIREKLPRDIRKRSDAINWLNDHWISYSKSDFIKYFDRSK